MKVSTVINTNKELLVLGLIKLHIWEGAKIEDNFIKFCNKYEKINNLEQDLSKNEIRKYLKVYICSLQEMSNFKKFIKEIRFYSCQPRSFKQLMENEGIEEFKNEKELHAFILSVLIPIVNNI